MNPIVKISNVVKQYFDSFLTAEFIVVATKILLIILAISIISYVVKVFFRKLLARLEKSDNSWDDILIRAITNPFITFIIIFGITTIFDISNAIGDGQEKAVLALFRNVGAIICITWFVLSSITLLEERYINRKKKKDEIVDYTSLDIVTKLLKTSVALAAILVIMDLVGLEIKGILAFAGIGGVAVALSAKELLSNFFGTIIIYTDKPFTIGECIRFPDKTEGVVEKISWRVTVIRTLEKSLLFVPNAIFTSMAIENKSRMSHRPIKEVIAVRSEDIHTFENITFEIKNMLESHPQIDNKQVLYVSFDGFDDSSVRLLIYAFTKVTSLAGSSMVKQDVILKAIDIIHKNGASVALPTRNIKVDGYENDNKIKSKSVKGLLNI